MSESFTLPVKSTKIRSLSKMISWRLVATGITWMVVYSFTGEAQESTKITSVSAIVLMALYYLHERFWNRIRVGRK